MAENNVLEDTMPYADKQKKAKEIAKQLLKANDLGRDVEMEVIREDDQVLADLVATELQNLMAEKKDDPVVMVQNREDIEKLPSGAQEAINDLIAQLGGQIPKGGLFQVKLDSVKGINTAVDTIIRNGTVNLGSLVMSRLAANRTTVLVSCIDALVRYHQALTKKLVTAKGAAKTKIQAELTEIDTTVKATFGEHKYDECIELCKRLITPKKKTRTRKSTK